MRYQSKCKALGDYGCLLFCYGYIAGVDEEYIMSVFETLLDLKIIDRECTVLSAEELLRVLTGENWVVVKSSVAPDTPYCCKYEYTANGKTYGHWVVKNKNKIIYNSLDNSQCVRLGAEAKVLPYRVVTRK